MKKSILNFASFSGKLSILLCIALVSFSGFKGKENVESRQASQAQPAAAMTTIYALNVFDNWFTDLNGVEYIDFLVEFHDENGPTSVTNLTVNYSISNWPNTWTYYYYKVCNGTFELLEDNAMYYDPGTSTYFDYTVTAGAGYQI